MKGKVDEMKRRKEREGSERKKERIKHARCSSL